MQYSAQQLSDLVEERTKIAKKLIAMRCAYGNRSYQTDRGKEFATQGFLRRFGTLAHCIDRVYSALPP